MANTRPSLSNRLDCWPHAAADLATDHTRSRRSRCLRGANHRCSPESGQHSTLSDRPARLLTAPRGRVPDVSVAMRHEAMPRAAMRNRVVTALDFAGLVGTGHHLCAEVLPGSVEQARKAAQRDTEPAFEQPLDRR